MMAISGIKRSIIRYMLLINAVLIVFSLMIIQNECWANEKPVELRSGYGFDIGYDLKGSYWFTSDDDDSEETTGHAFDYKPDLILTHALEGKLLWQGSPVFGLYYETAFGGDSVNQDTAVEVSQKASSIDKINAFLDFFFLNNQYNSSSPKFFSRLRLDYKHHVFVGKAVIQETTQYIAANSKAITLNPGDEIRFKSDFEEVSANLRLSDDFWMGIYQGTTVKPHETSTQVTQVLETEITGTGIKFRREYETLSLDANVGMVKFRARQANFSSDGYEALINFKWRPNIYLLGSAKGDKSTKHSLVITPLMGCQFSIQMGGKAEGYESDGTEELAMDIITDFGLQLKYIF